jgi:hypothetical protein
VKRQTKHLSWPLEQRLGAYAVAATASGVGVMCLAQPAEARIVYTPANVNIPVNTVLPIDLNHDGIRDFKLVNFYNYGSGYPGGGLVVDSKRRANEVWVGKTCTATTCGNPLWAAALPKGTKVGPKGRFVPDYPSGEVMVANDIKYMPDGLWFGVDRYLGLKFVIKGTTHYGWARLTVSMKYYKASATLKGYAYETIPGKPILAGATKGPDEPAAGSLGALAAGAAGR